MTAPNNPYGNDGSTQVGRDVPPSGTTSGADVTSRMTGAKHAGPAAHGRDRDADGVPDRLEHGGVTDTSRPAERFEERHTVRPAKTSAAAAFALVFGLSALFCALTAILAPAAVVFGLIGLVLGIVGIKKSRLTGVTGKGVAVGGLVMALLGLLLGGALIAGAAVFVNDSANLDRLQGWIDDARTNVPSGSDVVESVPGS